MIILLLLFLSSCKEEFSPVEKEYVVSIEACDTYGRCRVTSSKGRVARMHSPYIDEEICEFMQAPKRSELGDYFFNCRR